MVNLTTLCYIEKDNKYLMLYRNKKKNDINEGKWIGVGGHFEKGESPDDCLLREVYEETGLHLTSYKLRGIITFIYNKDFCEYMFLYTADKFKGEILPCNEGELKWIDKDKINDLSLWEGDRIFLDLLNKNTPVFSLKLEYENDKLINVKIK
ncbi:MAG: NUDIX hydrolase [Lachnospirales bacterium]